MRKSTVHKTSKRAGQKAGKALLHPLHNGFPAKAQPLIDALQKGLSEKRRRRVAKVARTLRASMPSP